NAGAFIQANIPTNSCDTGRAEAERGPDTRHPTANGGCRTTKAIGCAWSTCYRTTNIGWPVKGGCGVFQACYVSTNFCLAVKADGSTLTGRYITTNTG